ncbi:MAG: hypothetical protein M5U08_11285 [Burkholderiales bacterium]|nr:hypothetical protein [Burkholderiales bacterium]
MSAAPIAHETATRLRLRLPAATDLDAVREALSALPGITSLRIAQAARSIIVGYDGRARTRRAVLRCVDRQRASAPAQDRAPTVAPRGVSLEGAVLAAALVPVLPGPLRPAAAVGLVGARALEVLRTGAEPAGAVLDAIALASTALSGHPMMAATSVMVSAAAERWRDSLVDDTDRLLAQLTPAEAPAYRTRRGTRGGDATELLEPSDLQPGDRVLLEAGDVVPADGLIVQGDGAVFDLLGPHRSIAVRAGERVGSGERLAGGALTLRVERAAAASRAARLRAHLRHALRAREAAGPLTPISSDWSRCRSVRPAWYWRSPGIRSAPHRCFKPIRSTGCSSRTRWHGLRRSTPRHATAP